MRTVFFQEKAFLKSIYPHHESFSFASFSLVEIGGDEKEKFFPNALAIKQYKRAGWMLRQGEEENPVASQKAIFSIKSL